jgi:hypothetical protein
VTAKIKNNFLFFIFLANSTKKLSNLYQSARSKIMNKIMARVFYLGINPAVVMINLLQEAVKILPH